MMARFSRTAAIGVLFMIIGVSGSKKTSLRRGKASTEQQQREAAEAMERELAEAEAAGGTMDFTTMAGFSDIGMKAVEGLLGDGGLDFVIQMPADEAESSSDKFGDTDGEGRIIGGYDADQSNEGVPNNIVMLLQETGVNEAGEKTYAPNNCGGTLITNCHVLTAAHCVGRYGANDAVLVNARCPYQTDNCGAPKWKSTIREEWAHTSYSSAQKPYDVGILVLDSCVREDLLVSDLPPAEIALNLPSDGSSMVVAGFGRTVANSSAKPQKLQAVAVEKIPDSQCRTAYGDNIDSTQFCAGDYWNGGEDSCQGDSGGPLYVGTSVSSQKLAGVVSWGSGCADALKPGVYANLPYFQEWLNEQVCSDSRVNTQYSPICPTTFSNNAVDCTWDSVARFVFQDPSTGSWLAPKCEWMHPQTTTTDGINWNQYCSVGGAMETCPFACHSSCPGT